ncbi:RHS repeat-associated core domain-containing protein [Streptodolium elevatio]
MRGDRTKLTDPAGNAWTWTYDARGQATETTDPDKGRTLLSYDNTGRITSVGDARGNTLATTYDALGRKTTLRTSDANGPKLAEWTYDTLPGAVGLPVKSIRYDNGNAYTTEVTGYDTEYRPHGTSITIPVSEGALKGTYTTGYTYTPTGKVATVTLPGAGPLPAEALVTRYNSDGLPISTSGTNWYTSDTVYSPYGDVLRTQTGAAPTRLWTTSTYDEHTGQLLTATSHRETGPHFVAETRYGYDKADNITYINQRTPNAGNVITDDVQCFNSDPLRRLTDAWTSTNHCASGPKTGTTATVGGPDPYWTTYTYDAVGNRTTEKQHNPAGNTSQDTLRTYTYPAAPTGSMHQLSSVTTTGPAGSSTGNYTYDAAGNTLTRPSGAAPQNLTWDLEGHLARISDGTTTSAYTYNATGDRLIGRTSGTTGTTSTLYLGHTEITVAPNGTVTADRYYTQPGAPTVVRTSSKQELSYLLSDRNGTATTVITSTTSMPVQYRKTTAFGQARGAAPSAWPGTRGYVGGTTDTSSGLTHLGAREYDPTLGRFISVDPVMDLADPLQTHGYSYANSSPVTKSDPTGLVWGIPCSRYEDTCDGGTRDDGVNGPNAVDDAPGAPAVTLPGSPSTKGMSSGPTTTAPAPGGKPTTGTSGNGRVPTITTKPTIGVPGTPEWQRSGCTVRTDCVPFDFSKIDFSKIDYSKMCIPRHYGGGVVAAADGCGSSGPIGEWLEKEWASTHGVCIGGGATAGIGASLSFCLNSTARPDGTSKTSFSITGEFQLGGAGGSLGVSRIVSNADDPSQMPGRSIGVGGFGGAGVGVSGDYREAPGTFNSKGELVRTVGVGVGTGLRVVP